MYAAEHIRSGVSKARLTDWVRLFRPTQWLKNFFVLMPVFFSGRAFESTALLSALGAFAAFGLLASGVYAANDVVDRDADRFHPLKRFRPVASGVISSREALAAGLTLIFLALLLAWTIRPALAFYAALYLILNAAYMWRLKQVVVLDVFVVASFFVLRLLAGSAAIPVVPSVWLLLCGGLLALYLGFTKRRHELIVLEAASVDHRSVLAQYSPVLLDQLSMVLLSVTIVSYIMYTLESATATAVGSDLLSYSTIFVLFGVFRYLFLVHSRGGGSPTRTLLGDRQLLLVVACWVIYCGVVLYRGR